MINYFHYTYSEPGSQDAFSIQQEISSCPWKKDHRLLQVGLQARSIKLNDAVANYLTFLIDVSGSMESEEKLPLLQNALMMLVKQMREKDRVAIVVYAGNAGLVLAPTGGSHMSEILEAINQLQAGGSTAGGEGIVLAYKVALEQYSSKANNRVILATDGDFNVGVSDDASLVKLIEEKRDQGIFLSVLGFGTGNYQDAKMEKLADKGNGNYAYIDNLLEAKKVLVKEMGGTLVTVAKDVKIQVEFNPRYVKSYRLIGYDNRMLAHEDFKDDAKDAGEVGSGHSVTALYEIVPAGGQEPADTYKYQKNELTDAAMANEVCTIRLRYKEPVEKRSKEMVRVVYDEQISFENTSDNFRFCSAVAEFGMILRQSQFKGTAGFPEVIRIAGKAKGDDPDNYRGEFIRLCEMADVLANR
jgi:Ca-activated chloride channel family protein